MLKNSGPLKEAGYLHGDEGVDNLPIPTAQPGLAEVVFAAVKPAKLSHEIPALHLSNLLGVSWSPQERKRKGVR